MTVLKATLDLNTGKFNTALDGAEQAAKSKGARIGQALKRGLQIATGAAVGFSLASIKAAGDAQVGFAKLETVAGKDIGKLKQQIMNLPPELGRVGGAAEAAYQAISASVPAEKAVEFVRLAAVAAKGGFTDMTTAVDAGTTVLNAYGMEQEKAGAVFDKFLATQNLGKTTFGELGQSIGDVASTAASFGTDLDTLLGLLANATKGGIQTTKAVTGMRAAFSNLIKPTDDAMAELKKLGIDADKIKEVGIVGVLEAIKSKSTDTSKSVSAIFGSVEASGLVNRFLGNMETVKTDILGVANAAGSAQAAADVMGNTFNDKMAAVAVSLEKVAIGVGERMLPELEKATKFLQDNMSTIKAVVDEILATVNIVTGAVATLSQGLGAAAAAAEQLLTGGGIKGAAIALGASEKTAATASSVAGGVSSGVGAVARGIPVLGNILQASDFFGGMRASGGPVSGGKAYVVGEKGPEIMVPGGAGTVIPNGGTLPGSAGIGGQGDYFENLKERIRMAFHSGASEGIQKGGTEGVGTHKGKDTKGLSATLFKGAFDSSKTAMMESFKSGDVKGGIKIFAENLKDTASSLLKTGLSTVLKDILGSIGGGGGIGGLLGFAGGGEPPVGRASLVGERGPELFVPRTAGTIIPNHALGGGLTFAGDVHINASTEEGGRAAARGLFDELPELVRRLRRGEYPELQRAMAS